MPRMFLQVQTCQQHAAQRASTRVDKDWLAYRSHAKCQASLSHFFFLSSLVPSSPESLSSTAIHGGTKFLRSTDIHGLGCSQEDMVRATAL